jgi:hypothetical protein
VEILWWLAPPVVATVVAMLWVSWLGRARRREVDREAAVRRLADALSKPAKVTTRGRAERPAARAERGTGVAVRTSTRPRAVAAETSSDEAPTRRAS